MNDNTKPALQVSALCNGTVIDHIPADKLFAVVNLLNIPSMGKISVVAPNVVMNTIRDYRVVEKREVKMPDELHNIIKCNNLNCITNNEPMATHFYVSNRDNHTLKCRYCEKEVNINDVELL